VGKHGAELVVAHFADEPGPAAQRCDAGGGAGRRTARGLDGRAHRSIDRRRFRRIDELHGTFGHAMRGQEGVIFVGEDIDNRIAQRNDINRVIGHGRRK